VQISVQCKVNEQPALGNVPANVMVRPGALTFDDLSQLRQVLHELVTTARRTVTVDLTEVDLVRRTNVVAVLVGAAREARGTGTVVRVHNPPHDQRRALFVAGIDECPNLVAHDFEVIVGIIGVAVDAEAVAV
jgi:ABC-type transporter Mla MlaB component